MNNSAQQNQSGGIKLTPGDIIYTIFRHLKKIVFFFIIGLVSGAVIYKQWPVLFESYSSLIIRFVTEDRTLDTAQNTQVLNTSGRGGAQVIAAETAIITSLDLAKIVAEKIGPETLVTKPDQEPNILNAAGVILEGLSVKNPGSTNMIEILFQHENPKVAKATLETLITSYIERHHEIHRKSSDFEGVLTRETDQMRSRLQQTEKELQAAKSAVGVIDIGAAKTRVLTEMGEVRTKIAEGKTELAELNIYLEQESAQNAEFSSQNGASTSDQETTITRDAARELATAMDKYASISQRLELIKRREQTLSLQYTDENTLLKTARAQRVKSEEQLDSLRRQYPQLDTLSIAVDDDTNTVAPAMNGQQFKLRTVATQARMRTLETLLVELKNEAAELDKAEISVNELERRKELQEANYRGLLASMEKTRVQDEVMDGRINNITTIQSPTPARQALSTRYQVAGGVAAGVASLGLIWAFLTDLLLDRTIKRPTEIQRNLGIPLFMSLPDMNSKRFRKLSKKPNRQQLLQAGRAKQLDSTKREEFNPKSPTLKAAAMSKPEQYGSNTGPDLHSIAPWEEQHALNGHFDALRDKVITYFESKNLTHKPKLIAMTGLGESSGVTTIASGLAGSLSKIGEGSVLLVDMTLGSETAQKFYKGKNILNLDEVLDSSEEARVENKLYVVAEGSNGVKLPRIMPQRFNKIMPKLRASDFDYIIFDMPPVSPISSTPRLASFMDVVLMVMESEETNRDVANQALELLSDSRAHLGGILNKTKSRVPKKLEKDLLSQG